MKKILLHILLSFFCTSLIAQHYQKTALGIKINVQSMCMEIQFYTSKTVRILKSPEGVVCVKKSLSVTHVPEKVALNIVENGDDVVLTSTAMQVKLNVVTGKVSYFDLKGKELFTEKDYGTQFTQTKDVNVDTYIVRQAFLLDTTEAIYGLGQQQNGKMNQRNQRIVLRNENMKICIPFFQSTKGFGVFWDNYSSTIFTDNRQETSFESTVGDCSDYYFMYGGNADGVISEMRKLTGQAPLFPLWTYGYWQSRERYKSQKEIVDVVQKYRDLHVPLDGIIQDWQYWSTDNAYWNAMEFGNPNFPNPKAMVDQIHKLNAHVIISVWASFGPKTKPYKELNDGNMLMSFDTWPLDAGVKPYDPYNPQARSIYWKYLNAGIFSQGVDGWWLDSSEPDHFNVKEKDFDNTTYLGSFRKVVNAFPLMTTTGVYQHQRQATSAKRVFILTRSSFAGQQRNAAVSWSGDVVSDWNVFKDQIPAGLNFVSCGIPYWNTDIGGFFSSRNFPKGVNDLAFDELYVRWLQFATFCPMMRSHGTDTPREIYQFGKKGDWAYDAIDKFINLRYRFLPYNYATAWDVTEHAGNVMRPLFMDFSDRKVYDLTTEYMFGRSLLVCPVTDSHYIDKTTGSAVADFSQTKTQSVYLPRGAEWYDFWTDEKLQGGQTLNREIPIDIIPLYVKAGSILPLGPIVQYANEKPWDNLELRVYPGEDGTFTLYEDEKDNYNYEKGAFSTIDMVWNNKEQTLTIADRKGTFPQMLKSRTFKIILVGGRKGVEIPKSKISKTITYKGKKVVVKYS